MVTHNKECKLYGISLKNYSTNSKRQEEQQIAINKNSEKRELPYYILQSIQFSTKNYETYKVTEKHGLNMGEKQSLKTVSRKYSGFTRQKL